MPHVFISYSRKDSDAAQILNGHLLGARIETYLDDQLQLGVGFRRELQKAIDSSSAVVAICTAAAMASSEVLFELAYALGRRLPVIPVKWEAKCKIPPFLEEYQGVDLSRPPREFSKLVLKLKGLPIFPWVLEGWQRVGLLEIGSGRPQKQRVSYIYGVLESIKPGSKLIIVGRSLKEWASVWDSLERAINEKRLEAKLALLDENSVSGESPRLWSWIDAPLRQDTATRDVRHSMDQFRKIKVRPSTGSLKIYGLPFYASHSFIAYSREDGTRQCLQEAGMAAPTDNRPYLIVATPEGSEPNTFGALLEQMNEGAMTEERLVLSNDGTTEVYDTTHPGKILADKVKKLGMVDICVQREQHEWFKGDVANLIDDTPDGGGIFVMGRSLITWSTEHQRLMTAVAERGVQSTFAIADPTDPKLRSLVKGDPAEVDVKACWANFLQAAENLKNLPQCSGLFQVFGLPAYLPVAFGSYENATDKFCILEPGIAFGPQRRPSMYFVRVSNEDVYSILNRIFRNILDGREPMIKVGIPRVAAAAR